MTNKSFKEKISFLFLPSICLFFIIINYSYFYLNLFSLIDVNSYAFNELFINYQSGFIRRGLLGEIFWQINKFTSIDPKIFFSILFFILYMIQFYLFFKILNKFQISITIFIIVIFSPSLLLFHIYDPNMYFIKDIFIKLSFLLHGYLFLKSKKINTFNEKYIYYLKFFIIPVLAFTILIHEYQIFYISLHILISISTVKRSIDFRKIIKIYALLLAPIFFVIFFFGDQNQLQNLIKILSIYNVDLNPHLGSGMIKYFGAFYKWHFFYFSYRDFLNLFFSFLLSILLFYVLFQNLINKKILIEYTNYQKYYLILLIPTLIPIFLTTDHGRNFSMISFHLVVYFLTLKLNTKNLRTFCANIYDNFLQRVLIIIFIFLYIFMWKLDQMAGFGLRGIPNDIFQSSLFAEIIKFIKFLYYFTDLNFIKLPEIKL
tara:strand:+ start:194 stop:1483 length:1290 start_codon:yes stop_codon:yes gene_type:complete